MCERKGQRSFFINTHGILYCPDLGDRAKYVNFVVRETIPDSAIYTDENVFVRMLHAWNEIVSLLKCMNSLHISYIQVRMLRVNETMKVNRFGYSGKEVVRK